MIDAVATRAAQQQRPAQAGSAGGQNDFATELLIFESEVRQIKDERELFVHLCNSSRRIVPFRQAFYGKVNSKAKTFTLQASSSVSVVDRNAPFNRWIEKIAGGVLNEAESFKPQSFALPAFCDPSDEEKDTYPLPHFLWTPQVVDNVIVGGFFLARETAWLDNECNLAKRLGDLYLHAQAATQGQKALTRSKINFRPVILAACALTAMLGFLPVSVTALAPAEVLPKEPFVLAAPFDGVVSKITATQGAEVAAGEPIIIFDDVHLLNEKKLADQRAAIANARYQRASQGAIADYTVKREIEVSKAEYQLAVAESSYATELLEKARMTTPIPGIAIFSDKSDWEGKPVSAGQAIVSIADPNRVEFSIDLPVKDSLVLSQGARIKIFLDSDPLHPLEAVLTDASYQATPDKRDILSYSLRAELTDTQQALPRIGVQGTAQVYSEKASLAYVIFRRPLAAIRQYTGW